MSLAPAPSSLQSWRRRRRPAQSACVPWQRRREVQQARAWPAVRSTKGPELRQPGQPATLRCASQAASIMWDLSGFSICCAARGWASKAASCSLDGRCSLPRLERSKVKRTEPAVVAAEAAGSALSFNLSWPTPGDGCCLATKCFSNLAKLGGRRPARDKPSSTVPDFPPPQPHQGWLFMS